MSRRIKVGVLVLMAVVAGGLWIGSALAQQGERAGYDPEQMRQRYMTRVQEALAVSGEDWTKLEPKVSDVYTLWRQMRGGMGFGTQRRAAPGAEEKLTDLEQATADLQTLLQDAQAAPEQIKGKLDALRAAREKTAKQLAEARDALRKELNVRQEAQLVLMGLLE